MSKLFDQIQATDTGNRKHIQKPLKMKMKQAKYCTDCVSAVPDPHSSWQLKCLHPSVNLKDAWALASTKINGSNCREEREKGLFAPCGQRGKLWQQK